MQTVISDNGTQSNLKSVQILRAIAATSVVYFHIFYGPEFVHKFGQFGVDIFFVISGFVMAMVVTTGQSARKFAVSRLTRIIPLYWVITTCLLVVAATKPELLNSTTVNATNYFKSIFFIPYFKENGALHPMLAVGWTLNYEMFFYFCIWISIVTARKLFIPITFALIATAHFIFGIYAANKVLNAFFGQSVLFEFLFGILAYEIYKRGTPKKLGNILLLFVSLFSYVFMAAAETYNLDMEIARVYLYGIPSVFLVLSVTALEGSPFIRRASIANAAAIIGDGSYATYLSHVYVVEGIRKIVFQKLDVINPYKPLGVLIVVSFSLAVGHVIYKLCDKPLSTCLKKWFLPVKQSRLNQR